MMGINDRKVGLERCFRRGIGNLGGQGALIHGNPALVCVISHGGPLLDFVLGWPKPTPTAKFTATGRCPPLVPSQGSPHDLAGVYARMFAVAHEALAVDHGR